MAQSAQAARRSPRAHPAPVGMWLAEGGLPDLTGPVDSADDPHRDA
ncbi:hypothetical protein ACIP98_02435 [Streptomyces sp. NPDC088354]